MKALTLRSCLFLVVGPLAVLGLLLAALAAYSLFQTRDFHTWDSSGLPPIKSVMYYAHGSRVTEVFIVTAPGTKLSDIADMSLFGTTVPGLTPAQFQLRYGTASVRTARTLVTPWVEQETSSGATLTRLTLRAKPEPAVLAVADVFHRAIAGRILSADLTGTVHIHNGTSTAFLTCQIDRGRVITSLRWAGAA